MIANTNRAVLDASALLAHIGAEPGGEVVAQYLESAIISSVNWAEVVQRVLRWGMSKDRVREDLAASGLEIVSFAALDAEAAAMLQIPTRSLGLSLGDRACIALAQRLQLPILTADRAWRQLSTGVDITVIR